MKTEPQNPAKPSPNGFFHPKITCALLDRGVLSLCLGGLLLVPGTVMAAAPQDEGDRPGYFPRGTLRDLTELPEGRFKDTLDQLPEQARTKALGWLRSIDLPVEDVESLHVDSSGGICYGCHFGHHGDAAGETGGTGEIPGTEPDVSAAAVPVSPFPASLIFSSRPGSPNVLFINFAGENVTGTQWNTSLGRTTIPAKPYSRDTDLANFSDAEQVDIRRIWQRMAEDFAPFNINVTTQRPATFNTRTAMVLITSKLDANGDPNPSSTAGGVAYVNVFATSNFATYRPAWVYHDNLGNSEANIAEAASHEIGHNLGLTHDGTTSSDYYGGHGTGDISWGPLMGTGYGRNVSQWCKGEYLNANNTQDDLAQIAAKVSYLTDDHSGSATGATALVISGGTQIASTNFETDPTNSNPANKGIIERTTDVDVFSFVTGSGLVRLAANPWISPSSTRGGNLDVALELYNESGVLVAGSNPATLTTAVIETNLTAGRYFLHVKNSGAGTPLASSPSGYTSYGSIGTYYLSGFVTEATGVVLPPSAELVANSITTPGLSTASLTVTYSDDAGINVSTIGTGDIRVTGPNGFNVLAGFASVNSTTNGTPRSAVYAVAPPSGSTWTAAHNGSYTVSLEAGQVGDVEGAFAAPVVLGGFTVSVPIVYYSANMNTDPGWTLDPQWQYGTPSYSTGTAPTGGFTGTKIIAYNLSGNYANNLSVKNATTPAISVTGSTSLTLKFKRWLRKANRDNASIQVSYNNGTWTNLWTSAGQIQDSAWQTVQYALPSSMTGSGSVKVRWTLDSNNSQNDIGWNIDDVELVGDGSLDTSPPLLTLTVAPLSSSGSPSHACSVTYTDATAVRLSSLDATDLVVTGPGGATLGVEYVGADLPLDGSPLTGIYSIAAPSGGVWTAAHNGTYSIALTEGAVEDIWNNGVSAAVLGTFNVNISTVQPGNLTVSPLEVWEPQGLAGGGFSPVSRTFTLGNSGGSSLNWTAVSGVGWVEVQLGGGSLAPGQTVSVTATLNASADALAAGEYSGEVVFSNTSSANGGGSVPVNLTILEPGRLEVNPGEGFTAQGEKGGSFLPGGLTYTLGNPGDAAISWQAVSNRDWLVVGNPGGSLVAGGSAQVGVTIGPAAAALPAGVHTGTVSFTNTSNGNGNTSREFSLIAVDLSEVEVAIPGRDPGGAFGIAVRGVPGATVVLEASDTLGGWETLATGVIGPDGTASFTDAAGATLPRRFYRVRLAP